MNTVPTATLNQAAADRRKVIDALRGLHSETDRWALAEALLKAAPSWAGNTWFQDLADEAEAAGVPCLSVTTLRQYRDTAARWPADKRVPGASFTAHREVQPLINGSDVTAARTLLEQLIASHGAKKVTATLVRRSVLAQQGHTAPKKPSAGGLSLTDLMAGGHRLIALIQGAELKSSDLDKLHDGLTVVLTEVDGLRVKAARRSGAAAKAKALVPQPAPAKVEQALVPPPSPAGTPVLTPVPGDLRGL